MFLVRSSGFIYIHSAREENLFSRDKTDSKNLKEPERT